MTIKVALEHRTTYSFDRTVGLGPHLVRLRPAPHTRTPIEAYSLTVSPRPRINWQQDPFGNHVARLVFPEPAGELEITVGLVAELRAVNPFDFFVEPYAERHPFAYPPALAADLAPYLQPVEEQPGAGSGPVLAGWLAELPAAPDQPVVDFLVGLNTAVYRAVAYSLRMEAGVQTPDQTLTRRVGSCRDSAWVLVAALRHFGLAARFVSGYLVQLAADRRAGQEPSGPTEDFTDLHAWAEAYLPGAGWVGLDATSGLLTAEGHIPLAATPGPAGAAAVTGATEPCQVSFRYTNTVRRLHEDPRVSRPYAPAQVAHLDALGEEVDGRLHGAGLALTMGGEPTFVAVDDQMSAQWTVAADGPEKRKRANALAYALAARLAPGALLQRGLGKSYPGEPLPRWQIGLVWRVDGEPVWPDPARLADPYDPSQAVGDAEARASAFATALTSRLGLPASQCRPCYEDPLATLADDLRQPDGPRPETDPLRPHPDLAARLDRDSEPVAWALPLAPAWWGDGWASADWRTRRGRLVLVPGDAPAGSRLPLASLSWVDPDYPGEDSFHARRADPLAEGRPYARVVDPREHESRTALVVQPRDGYVHVFLPPLEKLQPFLALVRLLARVAAETSTAVIVEGYPPPPDPRIKLLLVTPDPGVIEVNLQPTSSWAEHSRLIRDLYAIAREHRLGAETFGLDGRHSGTGGGNHLTLGGAEPAESPLLRRPDLLVSLLTYWQHHPALSYLFSGRFVGATSQAPRPDEGRPDTLDELEIAFAEIARLADDEHRPWTVDRALRHLLTDITGNTHRAEFCIDKLYNPDTLRGRLGLLELRAFEMPPHEDMALVQALLVRALVARFAEQPYAGPLVRWGSRLHDQFLLPHHVAADIDAVVADLRAHGFDLDPAWFDPFCEFRFPTIGQTVVDGMTLELRSAIEPWRVIGDASFAGAARYVDSSTERLQVRVSGLAPERYLVTCNAAPIPLAPTGSPGTYVAGVRYQAWQPWSALHPTLPVDSPLVFEVIDRAAAVSLGGATYHVVPPGGGAYDRPPVNAKEAEARRAGRFETMGHTSGAIDIAALDARLGWRAAAGAEHPLTLDLRRRAAARWGPPASGPR